MWWPPEDPGQVCHKPPGQGGAHSGPERLHGSQNLAALSQAREGTAQWEEVSDHRAPGLTPHPDRSDPPSPGCCPWGVKAGQTQRGGRPISTVTKRHVDREARGPLQGCGWPARVAPPCSLRPGCRTAEVAGRADPATPSSGSRTAGSHCILGAGVEPVQPQGGGQVDRLHPHDASSPLTLLLGAADLSPPGPEAVAGCGGQMGSLLGGQGPISVPREQLPLLGIWGPVPSWVSPWRGTPGWTGQTGPLWVVDIPARPST